MNRVKIVCFLANIIFILLILFAIFDPITAAAIEANELGKLTPKHEELLIRSVITKQDETRLAKMLYGEDRQNVYMKRAAVVWCAFNRADKWNKPIAKVVTHSAFHGYYSAQKCPKWAKELVRDVALRYALEKLDYHNVGRTLPKNYLYFAGSAGHNRFRTNYCNGNYWDWSYPDPYNGK